MASAYQFRMVILAPDGAKANGVASWMNTNLGANTVPADLGPGLSPTGNSPATFRWCSIGLTDDQARLTLARVCDLAGVPKPTLAQWQGWTRAEKVGWLKSVQAALWTGWQIGILLSLNDGVWDDARAELVRLGLKRVGTVPG